MRRSLILVALAALALHASTARAAETLDPGLLAGLKARSIGPAAMSGRVAAVDGGRVRSRLVYVGAAAGGVWKSINGGAHLGADLRRPAGGLDRRHRRLPVQPGRRLGGHRRGQPAQQRLGRQRRLPLARRRPDLDAPGPRGDRAHPPHRAPPHQPRRRLGGGPRPGSGARTRSAASSRPTDGGKSWRKVLYVDPRTGAAELVMDPRNPNKLFAAMWELPALALGLPLRRPGLRALRHLRRRRDLEELHRGRRACPRATSGGSASPSRAPTRTIVYALVEAEKSAAAALGRRRPQLEDGQRRTTTSPSGRSTTPTSQVDPGWPEPRLQPDCPPAGLGRRRQDLRRRSAARATSTATTTRCGSTRTTPSTWSSATTAASASATTAARPGTSWATCRSPSSTTWRSTWTVPYNVYGGLQDNGSWRGPTSVWERRRHPQPALGARSAAATASTTAPRPERLAARLLACRRAAT